MSKFFDDDDFQETTGKVSTVIDERYLRSYGSLSGEIKRVDISAKPWRFTLFPRIGPKRVCCFFDEALYPKVIDAIGSDVTVNGVCDYSSSSPWPVRLKANDLTVNVPAPTGAWITMLEELESLWLNANEDHEA